MPQIPSIYGIPVNSSLLIPSDFSRELLGIHAGPLVLSISSRKEQMSPGLEDNEVGGCIAVPTIESGMYWAFDKCLLRGKKKKGRKEVGREGRMKGGKRTGAGRRTNWGILFFFSIYTGLTYVHVKSLQLHLTLCHPMNGTLPGSSVHGILQARTLEWVVMPSFRGSSRTRDWTLVSSISSIGRWVLYH